MIRWLALVEDALKIQKVIYDHGGMATKSIVEDVLIGKHEGVDRHQAHAIMNGIEQEDRRWTKEVSLAEYAPYMTGIEIRWSRGNPLEDLPLYTKDGKPGPGG
jgi:hypothetical protein